MRRSLAVEQRRLAQDYLFANTLRFASVSPAMFSIREANLPADSHALKAVIREYVAWLDMDLSYRGFDQEMADFNATFTLPSGMFFIAHTDDDIAGCAGLLRHSGAVAEVKRLYVRPQYRGHALGARLIASVTAKARSLGFSRLILDAVPQTVVAQQLYRALGFVEIAPYYANAVPGTRFYALALDDAKSHTTGHMIGSEKPSVGQTCTRSVNIR